MIELSRETKWVIKVLSFSGHKNQPELVVMSKSFASPFRVDMLFYPVVFTY